MRSGLFPWRTTIALAAGLVWLAAPPGVAAWRLETELAMAAQAVRVAPPHLRRQVEKRDLHLRAGLEEAYRQDQAGARGASRGGLDGRVAETVEIAVDAIEGHRPFDEIAYRLGAVAHYVIAANNPLNGSAIGPRAPHYAADYRRYMESARPRFSVMFYGGGPAMRTREDLTGRVRRSLERAAGLYPSIGMEYRRIGSGSGVELFDDRSTAFAVAALTFSHAISDTAEILRYIWLRAGGADSARLQRLGSGSLRR